MEMKVREEPELEPKPTRCLLIPPLCVTLHLDGGKFPVTGDIKLGPLGLPSRKAVRGV